MKTPETTRFISQVVGLSAALIVGYMTGSYPAALILIGACGLVYGLAWHEANLEYQPLVDRAIQAAEDTPEST